MELSTNSSKYSINDPYTRNNAIESVLFNNAILVSVLKTIFSSITL